MSNIVRTVAAVLLLAGMPASAEVTLCNGTWTNLPCSGKAEQAFGEVERSSTPPAEMPDDSQRRTLLSNLSSKNSDARQRWGASIDVDIVREYCLRATTSFDDCAQRVETADDRLSERIHDAQMVQAAGKGADAQAGSAGGATAISVVNQNTVVNDRRNFHSDERHEGERRGENWEGDGLERDRGSANVPGGVASGIPGGVANGMPGGYTTGIREGGRAGRGR